MPNRVRRSPPTRILAAPQRRRSAGLARALAVLLIGAAAAQLPCRAVRADAPSPEASEAHRRFQLGVQHFQAGRYAEALGNFEQAYRLKPHPLVRVNIANCYDRLQRPVEAIDAFEAFLAAHEGSEQQRREVEAAVDRLSKQLGRLVLRVKPASALSQIDAETEPRHGARWLVPGEHRLVVSAEGYESSTRSVQMRAGELEVVTLQLTPSRDPLVGAGELPVLHPPAPLAAGPLLPAQLATSSEPSRNRAALWISGGATLVLGVTALVTGQLALAANREFDADLRAVRNPLLNEFQRAGAWAHGVDASSRAESFAAATDVLLGLTLVGAGLTTYFWLAGGAAEERQAGAGVRAAVAPGSVQVSTQF